MHFFTLITVQFHCILEKQEKTEDNSIIFISVFSIPNAVNYFLSILVNNVMIYEYELVIVVLFSFILGAQGANIQLTSMQSMTFSTGRTRVRAQQNLF